MPDTPTLKPKWQLILGLLPSFNQAIILFVTAAVSIGGTLATREALGARLIQVQRLLGWHPVEKVTIAPAPIVEDKSGLVLDEIRELRRELLERLPPPKATKGKRR